MGADLASEVRVEEQTSTSHRIASSAATVLAMLGIAERGPIGASTLSTSFDEWQKQHGNVTANNLDVVEAVRGFFNNGGAQLRFGRVVHFTLIGDPTTKASAPGTATLQTASSSPTSGYIASAAQPFNLEPAQTLIVKIDAEAPVTVTFTATAASRTAGGAGPYSLADQQTLTLAIDGGSAKTKTFDAGEFVDITQATAEEVKNSLNAFFASQGLGCAATVVAGAVKVTSNRRGSGSGVNITGGTANVGLAFTTGNVAGTGNVSNIDAVTAAEVASLLTAAPLPAGATATTQSGTVIVTSGTTGTNSKVQIDATSTADSAIGFDNAIHAGSAGTPVATLRVDGKTDGAYAAKVQVIIAAATSGDADRFNLYVAYSGVIKERFANLSMNAADSRYAETVVNDENKGSDYIVVTDLGASPSLPATGTFGPLTGGDDGLTSLTDTDYTGGETANGATGARVFDADDIDLIAAPGRATSAVHNGLITYCEVARAGLAFAILDPPKNQTAAQMVTYVKQTASIYELSEHAAIYWPNVKVVNPDKALFGNAAAVVVAPSGHLAGIYARTDAKKVGGVFEQPAGTEAGVPLGVIGLETDEVMKKAKRDLVFPANINPISKEKGTPIFVDGARPCKLSGAFPSVGQRRGVIFVEKQLVPGLAFMRHRNIKPRLYAEGANSVEQFLLELTQNDAFKSRDPKKAFYVDFGPGLNPPSVQAARKVQARIGLATSEPAEFIVLLVGPDTRALDEELAALAA